MSQADTWLQECSNVKMRLTAISNEHLNRFNTKDEDEVNVKSMWIRSHLLIEAAVFSMLFLI